MKIVRFKWTVSIGHFIIMMKIQISHDQNVKKYTAVDISMFRYIIVVLYFFL